MHAVERVGHVDEAALTADLGDRLGQGHPPLDLLLDEEADDLPLVGRLDLLGDDDLRRASVLPREVARLEGSGEFVSEQALSPEGTFVRYDGAGRPPVTDGPFAETKDLIAGWMIIDVESCERAIELAGELSAAPGAGGKPIHEWLELRPFYGVTPTITE